MRILAVVAAVAALAATGLGKNLDRAHDAVVAVSPDLPGRGPATGTLVSARVVLTAGHVSPVPAPGLPAWTIAVGPSAFQPTRRIPVDPATGSHPHPLFLSFVNQFGRNPNERPDFVDLGLLVLPEPAGVAPAALPAPGILDRLSGGDGFLGVGYGYHEAVREDDAGRASASDGRRRWWRLGVTVLNPAWIRLDDDPAKGYGQICRGDSGAPVFLERGGRETLVAVVSHSDGQGCGPGIPTYAARVDNPAVLTWLDEAIARSR